MKIKHLVLGLLMGAALGFGTACSDDDETKKDSGVTKDKGIIKTDAKVKDAGVKDSSVKDSKVVMNDASKG